MDEHNNISNDIYTIENKWIRRVVVKAVLVPDPINPRPEIPFRRNKASEEPFLCPYGTDDKP